MREAFDAKEIGQYNYTHWTDEPIDTLTHKLALIPQTIMDGWEGYCSCGEWKGSANFYEIQKRDALLDWLRERHAEHKAKAMPSTKDHRP